MVRASVARDSAEPTRHEPIAPRPRLERSRTAPRSDDTGILEHHPTLSRTAVAVDLAPERIAEGRSRGNRGIVTVPIGVHNTPRHGPSTCAVRWRPPSRRAPVAGVAFESFCPSRPFQPLGSARTAALSQRVPTPVSLADHDADAARERPCRRSAAAAATSPTDADRREEREHFPQLVRVVITTSAVVGVPSRRR